MQLINFTPHAIRVWLSDGAGATGEYLDFPASGRVARCEEATRFAFPVMASPDTQESCAWAVERVYGAVTIDGQPFPDPQPGVGYLVSALCASRLAGRRDVFSPGTLTRDAQGRPDGCMDLVLPPPPDQTDHLLGTIADLEVRCERLRRTIKRLRVEAGETLASDELEEEED